MRILIVKLSSIGDIIKTYRAFYQIRFSYPDAHISWAVEDRYKDTVTHLKGLDDVIALLARDLPTGGSLDGKAHESSDLLGVHLSSSPVYYTTDPLTRTGLRLHAC